MQTIKYQTGRIYNGAQTLDITAPAAPADELSDVTVQFVDASRGITGTVTVMGLELGSASSIQHAVLREYDAGRYTLA